MQARRCIVPILMSDECYVIIKVKLRFIIKLLFVKDITCHNDDLSRGFRFRLPLALHTSPRGF